MIPFPVSLTVIAHFLLTAETGVIVFIPIQVIGIFMDFGSYFKAQISIPIGFATKQENTFQPDKRLQST